MLDRLAELLALKAVVAPIKQAYWSYIGVFLKRKASFDNCLTPLPD